MDNRTPIQSTRRFWTVSLALLFLNGAQWAWADKRPNVIVIFTDDHGYADLSCQEVLPDVRTPNIDELAVGGVRMTSGYITAPQCVPSRGGLLTGRYQNRFGLESNTDYKRGGLDGFGDAITIAERLKKAGYATGMAGKWHLGKPENISTHGFDKVFYKNSNRPGVVNFDLDGKDVPLGPESTGLYHLDACSAAANAFITRFKDQPFFFYLAYRAPHVPLDAPKKYLDRFPGEMPERRRKALAMMSAVDGGVGQIMETLREHDLEENTLIFFISDNGAPLKIHKIDKPGRGAGWDGSLNDPLNGEKGTLMEGGIRTPFVVYWKDKLPAGKAYDHPVISLDVAATVNELAGLKEDAQLDGVNLMPYLTGKNKQAPHAALYWRWIGQLAIRKGKWKYLALGDREYLFNLEQDIAESNNLLPINKKLAAELRADWDTWSQTLKPPGLTDGSRGAGQNYFDWYLDGKQD
ncbi:sulfatase-like hydrolase/transferase [Verrucomicrobia bacterium]|nr:sulfatase-like hydrolase/transferase [Verrucomicrobiota bacterium]